MSVYPPMDFNQGVIFAAAMLNRQHDQPGMAAEILQAAGLHDHDCANLDEFEKEQLRIINKENGMNLKNLDIEGKIISILEKTMGTSTWHIKNCLGLKKQKGATSKVLKTLKRMEREGKVKKCRVRSLGNNYVWDLPDRAYL